jgi:hypothetical protein
MRSRGQVDCAARGLSCLPLNRTVHQVGDAVGISRSGWSSQDSVDTPPASNVCRLELLGAHAAEMAVTAGPIVERLDVIGDVRSGQLAVPVDLYS